MVASEAYKRFLIKSEENSTNDVVTVSRDRFVELMNEAYIKEVEYIYEHKNDDDLRYIQGLLEDDKPIDKSVKHADHQNFKLPKDYLFFSNVWGVASKGECLGKKIDLFEIKDLDRNLILNDGFNSPSFKFREAPYNFANNSIRVFIDDFKVDKIYLSYYRYPKKLRLIDPSNPESPLDDSFELDLDDKFINRVISLAVKEFDIKYSNERFQLNQLRAQSKN